MSLPFTCNHSYADNSIRAVGAAALARALAIPGACPALSELNLESKCFLPLTCCHLYAVNIIGNEGMAALARALGTPGTCPALRTLNLRSE